MYADMLRHPHCISLFGMLVHIEIIHAWIQYCDPPWYFTTLRSSMHTFSIRSRSIHTHINNFVHHKSILCSSMLRFSTLIEINPNTIQQLCISAEFSIDKPKRWSSTRIQINPHTIKEFCISTGFITLRWSMHRSCTLMQINPHTIENFCISAGFVIHFKLQQINSTLNS